MNARRLAGSVHRLNRTRAPSQYWAMAASIPPVFRRRRAFSASSLLRAFRVSIMPSSSRFLATYPSRERSYDPPFLLMEGLQTAVMALTSFSSRRLYRDYRIKVPFSGTWREILNSDSALYGGSSNIGNEGAVRTLHEGTVPDVSLVVPPLAAIFLVPER